MSLVKTSPIIAIATGNGNAGVGIVRISGGEDDVKALFQKMFPGKEIKPRYAELLPIRDTQGQILDTGIVLYFRAPFSYTGESVLELQVHGGRVLLNWIVQEVLVLGKEFGLRQALPGEFTERAFLNGKIDLVQAEAVADLIEANSRNAAKAASRSLTGEFSNKVNVLNEALINLRVEVEAILDFPEEEIDFLSEYQSQKKLEDIQNRLESVLDSARQGEILRDGLRVALVGETNVGKSSLLNYLAGEEIAIVSDIAGTTRDKIQTDLIIFGVPFHFVDTAGIRETEDKVEQIGVEKSMSYVQKADLILALFDTSSDLTKEDEEIINLLQGKEGIVLLTKNDLSCVLDIEDLQKRLQGNFKYMQISTFNNDGIKELEQEIVNRVYSGTVKQAEGVFVNNVRQANALKEAQKYLEDCLNTIEMDMAEDFIVIDIRSAWEKLGEITGDTVDEDIIDQIFSQFCIGK